MNAALEILHAERDAVEAAIRTGETYVAACKAEIFKTLKNLETHRGRLSELQHSIERLN